MKSESIVRWYVSVAIAVGEQLKAEMKEAQRNLPYEEPREDNLHHCWEVVLRHRDIQSGTNRTKGGKSRSK